MRVNARLDQTTQQQLDYITQATGHSVSHVVRESVAQYYAQVRQQRGPSRLMAMAGQGDSGRSDVASDIKAELTTLLGHKHRLRPAQGTPTPKPRSRKPPAAR